MAGSIPDTDAASDRNGSSPSPNFQTPVLPNPKPQTRNPQTQTLNLQPPPQPPPPTPAPGFSYKRIAFAAAAPGEPTTQIMINLDKST